MKNASVEATEGNRCVIVGTNTVSRERTTDCGVTYGTVCVAYQLLAVNLVCRMRCENNRKFNTNTQEVPFDQMFFKCRPELDLFCFFSSVITTAAPTGSDSAIIAGNFVTFFLIT